MTSCPFAHQDDRTVAKPHGATRLASLTPLVRSADGLPLGPLSAPGKFGRLFPNLAPLQPPDGDLVALGAAMIETEAQENDPALDNPHVPAGFTYLGQFIDHDITFDTTTMPELAVDPVAVHNFRTPKLDLDCLYGSGPATQPYLYERAGDGRPNGLFLLGANRPSPDQNQRTIPEFNNDLPRTAHVRGADGTVTQHRGFALIGDPRNDENLLVAQTHLAFLKFHNKVLQTVAPDFEEARRIVTWHYQWIVLHDFLRRLINPAVLDDVLINGRKFYHFGKDAFIPVEFSVAAYRLGHSMVRSKYDHNRVFGPQPGRLAEADLNTLFAFSGFSGTGVQFGLSFEDRIPLPSNWIIDWRRFYELPRPKDLPLNLSRKLDPLLTRFLHNLPGIPADEQRQLQRLSVRNLLRGARNGLPSGQAVAALLRVPALTPNEVATGPDGQVAADRNLHRRTPLWYYILKEAEVLGEGVRLGPVGSRILAEVFVGLLEGDARSFLSQAPEWTPTLPSRQAGKFTMADLLTFVNEINPIGD